jgi:hypothetical protein
MLFNDKSQVDNEKAARQASIQMSHKNSIENMKALSREIDELESDIKAIGERERGLAFDAIDLDKRVSNLEAKKKRSVSDFAKGKCDRDHVVHTTNKLRDAIDERKSIDELVGPLASQKESLIKRKEALIDKYNHARQTVFSYMSDTTFDIGDDIRENILKCYYCYSHTRNFDSFENWLLSKFPTVVRPKDLSRFDQEIEKTVMKLIN